MAIGKWAESPEKHLPQIRADKRQIKGNKIMNKMGHA